MLFKEETNKNAKHPSKTEGDKGKTYDVSVPENSTRLEIQKHQKLVETGNLTRPETLGKEILHLCWNHVLQRLTQRGSTTCCQPFTLCTNEALDASPHQSITLTLHPEASPCIVQKLADNLKVSRANPGPNRRVRPQNCKNEVTVKSIRSWFDV